MAKKFMVLDVEGYSTCKPYDLGFKITDKHGTTYAEYSIAIFPAVYENMIYKAEHRNNSKLTAAHTMAHKNISEICNDTNGKYIKCFNIESLFTAFVKILQEHNIKRIWAFNCSFDRSALLRLFGEEKFSIIQSMVEFCDIATAILHTRLINSDYVNFCKTHNFMTEKGNVRTTAEVIYKYLFDNLGFTEEHTGLADVQIETQILTEAMKACKSVKRKPCQPWKILREFCVLNDIDLPSPDFGNMEK